MGGPLHPEIGMGAGLLREATLERQETSRRRAGSRIQMDSDPLSLLEGWSSLRRKCPFGGAEQAAAASASRPSCSCEFAVENCGRVLQNLCCQTLTGHLRCLTVRLKPKPAQFGVSFVSD